MITASAKGAFAPTNRAGEAEQDELDGGLLPVLVLIHGDSFNFGSGSTLNGLKLVQRTKGQLLVVTMNFRLNMLGEHNS